jgi:hypothetical protein
VEEEDPEGSCLKENAYVFLQVGAELFGAGINAGLRILAVSSLTIVVTLRGNTLY